MNDTGVGTDLADTTVVLGLMVWGLIPAIAGVLRVAEIAGGAAISADNARFVTAPVPVVMHIVASVVFCLLGAWQFASGLRVRHPFWHRAVGWVVVPCAGVAAFTGVWMAHFYPRATLGPASFDGPSLYAVRLLVGVSMGLAIWLGVAAIRRKEVARHRAWMIRGYALGLGAGTQVWTHIPWFLWPQWHSEGLRTLCMTAGWAINLAAAEWVIARRRAHRSPVT